MAEENLNSNGWGKHKKSTVLEEEVFWGRFVGVHRGFSSEKKGVVGPCWAVKGRRGQHHKEKKRKKVHPKTNVQNENKQTKYKLILTSSSLTHFYDTKQLRIPDCQSAECFSQSEHLNIPTWKNQQRLLCFPHKLKQSNRVKDCFISNKIFKMLQ